MKKLLYTTLCCAITLMLIDCAGSGEAGSSESTIYTRNLGKGTPTGIEKYTRRILNRNQYTIEEYNNSSERMYFETTWQIRAPLPLEQQLGASEARTKIFVTSRPRSRVGSGSAVVHVVRFRAENQLLMADTGDWVTRPLTDDFEKMMDDLSGDLKTEFDQMIRDY